MHIIDPPSYFAPADEWERFLAEMRDLAKDHPKDATIKAAIREAEEHLERIK